MCGRFTLRDTIQVRSAIKETITPHYNIAPSNKILALTDQVESMRWGYSPSWAKKPFNLVNARQETLGEKPSFRQSLRCLIFADGWYEWSRQMNGKQPYFFHLDHKLFFFAGIYGEYNDENCCCIVTTEANEKLSDIHHRMPIIVDGRDADDWLSGDNYPSIKLSEMIKYYPVSSMVNSPIHDNEGCIRQI